MGVCHGFDMVNGVTWLWIACHDIMEPSAVLRLGGHNGEI